MFHIKIIRLCKKYLLGHRYDIAIFVFLVLVSAAIGVASPYIMGQFLDSLIEGADVYVVLRFSAIYGSLRLIKILKGYITAIIYARIQTQMGHDLNMDAIKHIQNLSLSYTNKQDIAYLNQRIHNDATTLITFCISIFQGSIANFAMILAPFVILLSINWPMALLMVLFVTVYFVLYIFFKKPIYNASLALKEAQNKYFSKLHEQLKLVKLIRLNSLQNEINNRVTDGFSIFKDAAIHSQKVNYVYFSTESVINSI